MGLVFQDKHQTTPAISAPSMPMIPDCRAGFDSSEGWSAGVHRSRVNDKVTIHSFEDRPSVSDGQRRSGSACSLRGVEPGRRP